MQYILWILHCFLYLVIFCIDSSFSMDYIHILLVLILQWNIVMDLATVGLIGSADSPDLKTGFRKTDQILSWTVGESLHLYDKVCPNKENIAFWVDLMFLSTFCTFYQNVP